MIKFNVQVGDVSNDGHGRHENYLVRCSVPAKTFEVVLQEGFKALKLDYLSIAQDYCDCTISSEIVGRFENLVSTKTYNSLIESMEYDEEKDYYYIEDYIFLLQCIARISRHSIIFEQRKNEHVTLDLGGYGLFE